MEPIERCVKEFGAESFVELENGYGLLNENRTAMIISEYKPDDLEKKAEFYTSSLARKAMSKLNKKLEVDAERLKAFLQACMSVSRRPIIRLSKRELKLYDGEPIHIEYKISDYSKDEPHVYFDGRLLKPMLRLFRHTNSVIFMWRDEEWMLAIDIGATYRVLIAPFVVDE